MAVVSSCREMLGLFLKRAQPLFLVNFLKRLLIKNRRKERMMSSQHAPYVLGYTRATMDMTISCNFVKKS